jgi:hypothetical protein
MVVVGSDLSKPFGQRTWDAISVPPRVMRGFRNVCREDACLMAIQDSTELTA